MRAKSEENQKYFDDLRLIFERASELETDNQFDVDAAWNLIAPQLKHSKKVIPFGKRWTTWVLLQHPLPFLLAYGRALPGTKYMIRLVSQ